MYKSPIEIIWNDIVSDAVGKADEYLIRCVRQAGVNVDRDELVKALKYDRGQYEKGWNDREAEIVRCKDCIRFEDEDEDGDCWCYCHNDITHRNGYCSWGERREDDNH